MKRAWTILAAVALTFALQASVLAGDIPCPVVDPPPDSTQSATTSSSDASLSGTADGSQTADNSIITVLVDVVSGALTIF